MSYLDKLHLPQITSGDAHRVARITPGTLKNWLSRKPPVILLLKGEKVETGDRTFFNFTLQSVYHLAIVAEFVDLGFTPRRAHLLASAFTLQGDAERDPATLYPDGYTYIIGSADDAYVRAGDHKTLWIELSHRAMAAGGGNAVTSLNVTKTVWGVRMALGLPKFAPEERGARP